MTSELLNLVDLPFAFSQQTLLTPDEFVKQAARRGHRLSLGLLESYHRTGILVPVYRARKLPWPVHSPHSRTSLIAMRDADLLIDPRDESFHPWHRFYETGLRWDWSSRWLYSPYQLLSLRSIEQALNLGRPKFAPWGVRYPYARPTGRAYLVEPRLLVALTSLERRYLPDLTRRLPLPPDPAYPSRPDGDVYLDWMRAWDAPEELARLDYDAPGILDQAKRLLIAAGWFDPLENWLPVIRHANFQAWDSFTHEARLAIDYRVAAELLLMFYEDLVEAKAAEPIPDIPPMAPHPFQNRLTASRETLDADLTDVGLSPHPLIVLVLEGKTEMVVIPAALRAAGYLISHSTIQVINGQGTARSLVPLIAPLIAPEVTPITGDPDFLMLNRPATRLVVATDMEGKYTPAKRKETRTAYVEAVAEAMQQVQGVTVPEAEVDRLVSIHTWGLQSFEFACFTNHQLASAITTLKGPTVAAVTDLDIAKMRKTQNPNHALDTRLHRHPIVSKPRLARKLTPLVEERIRQAVKRNSLQASPIGRLILHIQKQEREIRTERTVVKGSF